MQSRFGLLICSFATMMKPPLFAAAWVPSGRRLLCAVVAGLLAGLLVVAPGIAAAATAKTWPVIGQQGLVRFVIVPVDQASDQDAYDNQIASLCELGHTCFLNFYTNTSSITPAVPLPDAIANEATATFRRSMKNGLELFMWSCRMKIPSKECF
jgi:hypothetical protein